MRSKDENSRYGDIAVAIFAMLIPPVLYFCRSIDDNRLTSWRWTFENIEPLFFILMLVGVVLTAFFLSRLNLLAKRPVFLFVFSFISASFFWGEPEVIVDASRYFTQAKLLAVNGPVYFFSEWGKAIFVWTDLPLIPFFYGLIFKFLGESRIFIQLFTTLLFASTVLLVYYFSTMLKDEETGFYGGLLMLGFPYLYTQIPLMLVDVPTMFFLTLAMYLLCWALEKGGFATICLAAISLFIVFFAKFSTWVFLTGTVAIFFSYLLVSVKQTVRRGIAVAVMAFILIGLIFFMKQDVFVDQIRFLFTYQKPGLGRWGEGYMSTFLFQTHPFIIVSAILGFFTALVRRDFRYLSLGCVLLIIFIMEIKRIRYTLPLFPVAALLGASGVREISGVKVRQFVVWSVVTTSLFVAHQFYLPFMKNMSDMNVKNAGYFINSLDVDQIDVILLYSGEDIINPEVQVPLLDYYSDADINVTSNRNLPDKEKYSSSSLRFTWEYSLPDMYYNRLEKTPTKKKAAVIIASQQAPPLTPEVENSLQVYENNKIFDRATNIFTHRTKATVFFH